MIGPRNLHPDELGDTEGMDLQDAMRVAARLTESMDDIPAHAELDFTDQVMAALADEPTPGATGFLLPLRRHGFVSGFRDSVRQAWAAVGSGRPMLGRTAALAYVLAVAIAGVSLTGIATLGAAGAIGLLNPAPSVSPTPPAPAPTPVIPPTIAPSPSPNSNEATDAPSPSPSETPDESEGPDDNGGSSGPGGGDDGSGSGGDDSSGPGGGDDSSGPGGGESAEPEADDSSGPGDDDSSGRGSGEG